MTNLQKFIIKTLIKQIKHDGIMHTTSLEFKYTYTEKKFEHSLYKIYRKLDTNTNINFVTFFNKTIYDIGTLQHYINCFRTKGSLDVAHKLTCLLLTGLTIEELTTKIIEGQTNE